MNINRLREILQTINKGAGVTLDYATIGNLAREGLLIVGQTYTANISYEGRVYPSNKWTVEFTAHGTHAVITRIEGDISNWTPIQIALQSWGEQNSVPIETFSFS